MKSKHLFLTILIFSAMIELSTAQDSPQPSHFRALSWKAGVTDLVLAQVAPPAPDPTDPTKSLPPDPDYKETPVNILAVGRSPFYPYDRSKPLYFVRHKGNLFKTVATVDLSTSPNLPLLFFIPTRDPDSFQVRVVPDDAQSFPGGSFRFVNMSNIPITVFLCGQPKAVGSGQIETISPRPRVPGRVDMVMVSTSDNRQQYSNLWAISGQIRYLMFIAENPSAPGHVDCLRLPDPVASSADPNQQKVPAVQ